MPPSDRRRRLCRAALLAAAVLALVVAAEAGRVAFGHNDHTVVAGRVYRSAQLDRDDLKALIARHGIRTVVNLRGRCAGFDWYRDECLATADADVCQEDIAWSASRLPPPVELRRLVETLDQSEPPLVVHCRRGVDRTGLASAVAVLLTEGSTLAQARRQLSLRYGHLPVNGTERMDECVELYAAWLEGSCAGHTPDRFRRWATQVYCPGEGRATIEPLDWPQTLPAGRQTVVRVRAHNTSVKPWRLRPGRTTGTHARWVVAGIGNGYLRGGEAGLFDAEVPPGGSIDLDIPLPPLPGGASYLVFVDMIDARQTAFLQVGSEPLLRTLRAE
jgi:protein tyrosine phosphatase (PTP) superfamily phosphohydrolase (DUF442 family)